MLQIGDQASRVAPHNLEALLTAARLSKRSPEAHVEMLQVGDQASLLAPHVDDGLQGCSQLPWLPVSCLLQHLLHCAEVGAGPSGMPLLPGCLGSCRPALLQQAQRVKLLGEGGNAECTKWAGSIGIPGWELQTCPAAAIVSSCVSMAVQQRHSWLSSTYVAHPQGHAMVPPLPALGSHRCIQSQQPRMPAKGPLLGKPPPQAHTGPCGLSSSGLCAQGGDATQACWKARRVQVTLSNAA